MPHLFWDCFTHAVGYMVQHIWLLREPFIAGDYSTSVFKLLHFTSVRSVASIVLNADNSSLENRTTKRRV